MYLLSVAGRLSLVSMLRQIVQNSPVITYINVEFFSNDKDKKKNIGELVLEILLSSSNDLITNINLENNSSWFKGKKRKGNVDLLMELITKQTSLQSIYL